MTGANAFPIANGELELRWGTSSFLETVNVDYPQMGGTLFLTGSFISVGGRSAVADPLVPALYQVWAHEAGTVQRESRWSVPQMTDQTTNLGPAANSTKFRPRRAVAYVLYTTQTPAQSPASNVRVQQRSASGGNLDTTVFGNPAAVPNYLEKYPIPLHRQADRLVITNDDTAFNLSFTVDWLLDLG